MQPAAAPNASPTPAVMRRILLTLLVVLASTARLSAQSATACPVAGFSTCAVRAESHLLGGVHIVRGLDAADAGRARTFGGPDLSTLLAGSDSATAHAQHYTRSARRSGALGVVAAALFVAAAVVDLRDREVTDAGVVLVGAGSAVGLASLSQHFAAQRELSRAVWWYNRDLATR